MTEIEYQELTRFIDNKNPRVTKIPIKWGDATTESGLNGEQVITEQMTDASLEDKIQNDCDENFVEK
uniref:Uncharacterized protein n=1 Tax=Romanomermis culicivorax TaxID=13658 RepID=A0A915IGH5_ROMCU